MLSFWAFQVDTRGGTNMAKQATKQAAAPQVQPNAIATSPTHEEIAALAYSLWQDRGYPIETPDEDWFNAERALKARAGA